MQHTNVDKCECVFTAASGRGREGGLGVRFTVRLEVPSEAEKDGQFQETQVEVPHGAAGEDGAVCHLCSGVFSGEEEKKKSSGFIMW